MRCASCLWLHVVTLHLSRLKVDVVLMPRWSYTECLVLEKLSWPRHRGNWWIGEDVDVALDLLLSPGCCKRDICDVSTSGLCPQMRYLIFCFYEKWQKQHLQRVVFWFVLFPRLEVNWSRNISERDLNWSSWPGLLLATQTITALLYSTKNSTAVPANFLAGAGNVPSRTRTCSFHYFHWRDWCSCHKEVLPLAAWFSPLCFMQVYSFAALGTPQANLFDSSTGMTLPVAERKRFSAQCGPAANLSNVQRSVIVFYSYAPKKSIGVLQQNWGWSC